MQRCKAQLLYLCLWAQETLLHVFIGYDAWCPAGHEYGRALWAHHGYPGCHYVASYLQAMSMAGHDWRTMGIQGVTMLPLLSGFS